MRLDFSAERVMAVVAHPDDAELLCAGTLARARRDGAAIAVCTLCQGDKGQPGREIANLAEVRSQEAQEAASLLGAELYCGEVPDGTLSDDPATRSLLTEILRQFRPTLLLAHSPSDYHPDHVAASALSLAASWFCASHGQETETPAMPQSPELWWMDTLGGAGFQPSIYIDISDFADLKRQMLACHKSQLQRGEDQDFTPLESLTQCQMNLRGVQAGVTAAEGFAPAAIFKRTGAW